MVTVIVSFHSIFITKVDRAYNVKCFYMESEEVVTSHLQVSMLPTTSLYDKMSMPSCEYSVRKHSPNGPVVTFANVGDRVYHVWECKGADMGIMVKKCYVKDGRGQRVAVLDYNGCTLDDILLDQLTYDRSLMRAYAASMVFKYADESQLFFTCQIVLCQKSLNLCAGITPPKCSGQQKKVKRETNNFTLWNKENHGDSTNRRFHANFSNISEPAETDKSAEAEHLAEIDVLSPEITVVDLDKHINEYSSPNEETSNKNISTQEAQREMIGNDQLHFSNTPPFSLLATPRGPDTKLCFSSLVLGLLAAAISVLIVLSSVFSLLVYKYQLYYGLNFNRKNSSAGGGNASKTKPNQSWTLSEAFQPTSYSMDDSFNQPSHCLGIGEL